MNRREFIAKTVLGATSLAVLPAVAKATTGFPIIDKCVGAFPKGEINVIAGFSHTQVENFKLITP